MKSLLDKLLRRRTVERDQTIARVRARRAVVKLQKKRPAEIFPGANGTRRYLPCCDHEVQSRGATWTIPTGACATGGPHVGRCLGCAHCRAFTEDHARLW